MSRDYQPSAVSGLFWVVVVATAVGFVVYDIYANGW